MKAPELIIIIFLVSQLIACYLIYRLWRSNDYLLFKIVLSFVALIPVFGPIIVYWLITWPDTLSDELIEKNKDVNF